jgi:hypothetical protein
MLYYSQVFRQSAISGTGTGPLGTYSGPARRPDAKGWGTVLCAGYNTNIEKKSHKRELVASQ